MDDELSAQSPRPRSGTQATATLIELARNGQSGAFETLLTRYRPYLRLLADQAIRQLFDRKFDSSDAVQHTCLDAFRAMEQFRGQSEADFHVWITTILHRNLASLMRTHMAQKRDVRREIALVPSLDGESSLNWLMPADSGTGPSSRIVKGEAALLLAEALAKLEDRQRTAVQMRFLEGYKLSEIAAYLEITASSAATLIDRGLATLRKRLPHELADIA